jgi:hypothetical protein
LPNPATGRSQFVEMLLTEIELVFRVAVDNGEGGNGIGVVAVEITGEHDSGCLRHIAEYAAIEQKIPFAT